MQTHERSKIIMPLNLQDRHQSLRIPPGWSAPEFSLGQIVCWKITNPRLKADEAWGQIIGLIPFHFEEATLSWKVLLLITRCLG
jgi:hypothetical protein